MRRIGLIISIVAFVVSACSKETEISDGGAAGQKGEVIISLTSVDDHKNVTPVKSTVDAPETEAFKIEIFNSKGTRLFRDTYGNAAGTKIPLNAGDYRLLASYGDSLAVGFDAIYFAADQNFTVRPQTAETINATARMANVKIAVNFGDNLCLNYPEHYAAVRHPELEEYLQFDADETRPGYIPGGDLVLEIYAKEDGTWKYFQADPMACAPNDFVTFNVDIDTQSGDLKVGISIDDSVEEVNKEIVIPADKADKAAPAVSLSGFDGDTFSFTEAVDYPGTQADFVAEAGIRSCILETVSGCGLPGSVDLATADESVMEQFAKFGIRWNAGMQDKRIASVDFSGMGKNVYDPEAPFSATFTLTVTDQLGRSSAPVSFTASQVPPQYEFAAVPGNAFARRIEGLSANVPVGNPAAYELQYSSGNSEWKPVAVKSIDGQNISYDVISGLAPETEYTFRTVYNGNAKSVSALSGLTTETELQIANSGFEDWTVQNHTFNYISSLTKKNIDWYLPYSSASSSVWAVNSKKTMPGKYTTVGNQNTKNFPSVAYSTDAFFGSRSAMLYTVRVHDLNFDPDDILAAGELFIGKADDSGNHSSEGTGFTSRPDELQFQYKYESYNNETYLVEVRLYSGDTVIATGTLNGQKASSWTPGSVKLTYSDRTRQADKVYISFKSSSAASPAYREGEITVADNKSYTVYYGSVLYVDQLNFVY